MYDSTHSRKADKSAFSMAFRWNGVTTLNASTGHAAGFSFRILIGFQICAQEYFEAGIQFFHDRRVTVTVGAERFSGVPGLQEIVNDFPIRPFPGSLAVEPDINV